MKPVISTVGSSESKALSPTPYIFPLPTELLLEVMELLWDSAVSKKEQRNLINCLPLVSKTIGLAFYKFLYQEVTIPSREFYDYYIARISELDRSHPMNTSCKSLHFHVDRIGDSAIDLATECHMEPLNMGLQWKSLDYFNGKSFLSKGLFPNLTHLAISIHSSPSRDPYHALFPYFMPKTVQTVHINYSIFAGHTYRDTPIRYSSIPHKLKRLTVTGLRHTSLWYNTTIARLWESLFEVEELVIDGQVLPVGKNAPRSLDMNQACDMIESGCKGIGWNWLKRRKWCSWDEYLHWYWDWENAYGGRQMPGPTEKNFRLLFCRIMIRFLEYLERLCSPPDFPQVDQPIRRLKSFSYLQDSSTVTKNRITVMPIRRTKSCTELTTTGYPYGSDGRVWDPETLSAFNQHTSRIRNSSIYESKLDEIWEYAQEMI